MFLQQNGVTVANLLNTHDGNRSPFHRELLTCPIPLSENCAQRRSKSGDTGNIIHDSHHTEKKSDSGVNPEGVRLQ